MTLKIQLNNLISFLYWLRHKFKEMTFQSIVSFIQNPPTKRWTVSEVRYFPQMHWMRSLSFLLSSWKLPYRRHTGWERRFCDIAITLQLQQLVDGVLKKVSCKIFVSESNGRVYAETAGTARHRVQKGLKKRTEYILCCLRRYNICSGHQTLSWDASWSAKRRRCTAFYRESCESRACSNVHANTSESSLQLPESGHYDRKPLPVEVNRD